MKNCSVCGNPGGVEVLNSKQEVCYVHLGVCKAKWILSHTGFGVEEISSAKDYLKGIREETAVRMFAEAFDTHNLLSNKPKPAGMKTTTSLTIKFKKLHPDAKIPTKATEFAAGFDINTIESHYLQPGECHTFSTGLASCIPCGFCVVLFDRSGMGAKKNIHRLAGVIDEDYRGEWKVCLANLSYIAHQINAGDNIIQGLMLPVPRVQITEVSSIDDTERGDKGFGELSGD
jgi:dUTP pyrophosphatase